MVITSNVGPARTLDGRSCIRPPPRAFERRARDDAAARGTRERFHSAQSFGPTAYPESYAVARALLACPARSPPGLFGPPKTRSRPAPRPPTQCEAPEADEAAEVSFG